MNPPAAGGQQTDDGSSLAGMNKTTTEGGGWKERAPKGSRKTPRAGGLPPFRLSKHTTALTHTHMCPSPAGK